MDKTSWSKIAMQIVSKPALKNMPNQKDQSKDDRDLIDVNK